jgi:hypothetical protein
VEEGTDDDHWSPLDSLKECASRVGEASDAFLWEVSYNGMQRDKL